jgi:pyrroline-5-carboxylate reductase
MKNAIITFIGAGNMGHSLIAGLIADGYPANQIWATDSNPEKLAELRAHFAINTTPDNHIAASHADAVLFAVKPQILKTVVTELAPTLQQKKCLVISIAAGIHETNLCHWLPEKTAIVTCMPNSPALIRAGATALYANSHVSTTQKNLAESILRAVGITVWLTNENQLDIVTALSGSGPAYFFRVIEAMEAAAAELGLPADLAHLLTVQTALGAARMALESSESPATLRQRVTSPGGTTERALEILESGNITKLFSAAIHGAQQRAKELAEKFGDK